MSQPPTNSTETDTGTADQTLSTDVIFELLSHHRRRTLLDVLRTHDEPLALADIAEEVSAREQDTCIDAIPAEDVTRTHVLLYHQHIQKLDSHGVVAHDQDRDIVALTDVAEELVPFLELADEAD